MFRTIASRYKAAHSLEKNCKLLNVTRSLKDYRSNIRAGAVTISGLARRKSSHRILTSSQNQNIALLWNVQIRQYASLPSHNKVNLPALSPTMEKGSIVRWEKKEGDKLNEGDLLCEIETDKATMGFETPEEGYLAKIVIPAGAKGVPVGDLLCIIVENEADVAAFKDFKDDGSGSAPAAAAPASAPAPAGAAAPAPAAARAAALPPQADVGRVYASPMARRLAEIKQVRLGGTGSGLYGSLKSGDLAGAPAAAPAPSAAQAVPRPAPGQAYIDIPLSTMREVIAKRLTESKQSIPHYQLTMCINVDKTIEMRDQVNKKLEKSGQKVSINDFIIKAVAAAAVRVPEINSYWMGTSIRQFTNVDVSVAVATPSGLITPIINSADSRGILDISKSMKELAKKAKEGKLSPNEYQGGTITVSNLGMFGITMFNAIINPPQAAIVACGGLQDMPVVEGDGFRIGKFIYLTVSADHRVTDGVVGARFMKELKENLEDPANMIM